MLAPEGPWDGYIYVRDGYGVFRQANLGVAAVKSRNLGSVVTDRTSILFCVYHNPDLRMFTNITGSCARRGSACLVPVYR